MSWTQQRYVRCDIVQYGTAISPPFIRTDYTILSYPLHESRASHSTFISLTLFLPYPFSICFLLPVPLISSSLPSLHSASLCRSGEATSPTVTEDSWPYHNPVRFVSIRYIFELLRQGSQRGEKEKGVEEKGTAQCSDLCAPT